MLSLAPYDWANILENELTWKRLPPPITLGFKKRLWVVGFGGSIAECFFLCVHLLHVLFTILRHIMNHIKWQATTAQHNRQATTPQHNRRHCIECFFFPDSQVHRKCSARRAGSVMTV